MINIHNLENWRLGITMFIMRSMLPFVKATPDCTLEAAFTYMRTKEPWGKVSVKAYSEKGGRRNYIIMVDDVITLSIYDETADTIVKFITGNLPVYDSSIAKYARHYRFADGAEILYEISSKTGPLTNCTDALCISGTDKLQGFSVVTDGHGSPKSLVWVADDEIVIEYDINTLLCCGILL